MSSLYIQEYIDEIENDLVNTGKEITHFLLDTNIDYDSDNYLPNIYIPPPVETINTINILPPLTLNSKKIYKLSIKNKTKKYRKRAPRIPVPEHMKDEKYYNKREKNTELARKSRLKSMECKIKNDNKMNTKLEKLNQDNIRLIKEKKILEKQFKNLKELLVQNLK